MHKILISFFFLAIQRANFGRIKVAVLKENASYYTTSYIKGILKFFSFAI